MDAVVVFGGNGTVGVGVCSALRAAGFDVHALCRRGAPPAPLADREELNGVHWRASDIENAAARDELLAQINPRFAVVTIGRLQPWAQLFPAQHAAVERAARIPAEAALAAAASCGVERAVYVSGLFPAQLAAGVEPPALLRPLAAFLAPQRAAKAAVEARLLADFGTERGLVIRAGLVCGYQAQAPLPLWLPPGTRSDTGLARVRRIVSSAARAEDIGRACARFFKGTLPGGVIDTTAL